MSSIEWRLVSEKELAGRLGCTIFCLRQWRKHKRLPFLKIGRLVRFDLSAVQQWISQQQTEARS